MIVTDKYHVHVYYSLDQFELASRVRDKMMKDIPSMQGFGLLRDRPIGPHPTPMFEAWFGHDILDEVLKWVSKNRQDLSVMFHPLSGNDYADHAIHAKWIGDPLPLKLDIFKQS